MKILNFKPWGILVVMFALIFTLAACQEELVETLEITETSVTVDEGEEYQLRFTTTIANDRLTWISSSNEILTVVNGRIHALKPGRVTVRVQAKNGAIYDQVNVVVNDVPDPTPPVIEVNINGEVIVSENPIAVSDLEIPSQERATFVGWFTDESLTQAFDEEVIDTSITLYPKFEDIPSAPEMVTVDLLNEAGELIEATELPKGSTLNRANLPEEPENFVGYYTESMVCGDTPFDVDSEINEDVSLTQVLEDASTPCVAIESVTIEGTPQVGESLTAAVTPENADVTIQWQVDGTVVGTGVTLVLDETYEASEVSVSVTGQNDFTGSAQATSDPVETIVYTVTVINEAGETLTTLEVEDGGTIDAESLPELGENEMGYYTNPEACDTPFDLDSSIDENKTLYVFTLDNQLPCAELELLAITGEAKVGETLIANVFPAGAEVSYQWFVSDNNIAFTPLVNVTGPSLIISEDLEGKYIAVNVIGEGSYEGLLKTGTEQIYSELKTLQESESSQGETPQQRANRLINEENWIGIETEEDLRGITTDGNYVLLNDITIQSSLWDETFDALRFNGTLDGNSFSVKNLNMTGSGAFVEDSANVTLSNIIFENLIRDSSKNPFGAIKNNNNKTGSIGTGELTILNVHISGGTIQSSNNDVGGFVGINKGKLSISGSSFNGEISGDGDVGGFVGTSSYEALTIINNSYFNGDILASSGDVGGLIGYSVGGYSEDDLVIRESYVVANITGSNDVGGLVGFFRDGKIYDSYSISNINALDTANPDVGGLVGYYHDVFVSNSYFSGIVMVDSTPNVDMAINEKGVGSFTTSNLYHYSQAIDYGESNSTEFNINDLYNQLKSHWSVSEYINFMDETWVISDALNRNTLPYLSWQDEPLPEQILPE